MNSSENFSCQTAHTLAEIARNSDKPLALAIGVFDGVHLGHQKLLEEICTLSGELGAMPVALTFAPHPRSVLQPSAPPVMLFSLSERIKRLREFGMQEVAVVNFTREFAETPAEEFVNVLLERVPRLAAVGVGTQWRFGARGAGNVELLQKLAAQQTWQLVAVPELVVNNDLVSASRIRRSIAGGDLATAEKLLGCRYYLTGQVANGFGIAGTNLNCPTANIVPDAGVLPPDGVYAGAVTVNGCKYCAAVNIGVAPTYARGEDAPRRIEAHLLDFDGNLYGKNLKLELACYLRCEQCFASEELLRQQIQCDVAAIRKLNW